MRYALRRQDKIATAYGGDYLEGHIIASLDGFFTRKGYAEAQEALPDHIKAKMKADRDKAKLEAYHKQCPCWNSHNDSCYDDNCPCDRDCEYMKSFNLKDHESICKLTDNRFPA